MTLLKRRVPLGFLRAAKESLWPSMGWRRTWHYYRLRLIRQNDSTYKITAGLATGISVCFSPLLGTHMMTAAALSWLFRASIPAALIGTFIGTPVTYPPMFMLDYEVGARIFRLFGSHDLTAIPDRTENILEYIAQHSQQFFLPMMVGAAICGPAAWVLSYTLLYRPIEAARRLHRLQKLRRIRKKQGR